jgi:hypothetical protein
MELDVIGAVHPSSEYSPSMEREDWGTNALEVTGSKALTPDM